MLLSLVFSEIRRSTLLRVVCGSKEESKDLNCTFLKIVMLLIEENVQIIKRFSYMRYLIVVHFCQECFRVLLSFSFVGKDSVSVK